MSALEILKQLEAKYSISPISFQQAKEFLALRSTKLSKLNEPTVDYLEDSSVVIEWVTKDAIWSIDFADDKAYAMVYYRKHETQDEMAYVNMTDNMQTVLDFFEKHYGRNYDTS